MIQATFFHFPEKLEKLSRLNKGKILSMPWLSSPYTSFNCTQLRPFIQLKIFNDNEL